MGNAAYHTFVFSIIGFLVEKRWGPILVMVFGGPIIFLSL